MFMLQQEQQEQDQHEQGSQGHDEDFSHLSIFQCLKYYFFLTHFITFLAFEIQYKLKLKQQLSSYLIRRFMNDRNSKCLFSFIIKQLNQEDQDRDSSQIVLFIEELIFIIIIYFLKELPVFDSIQLVLAFFIDLLLEVHVNCNDKQQVKNFREALHVLIFNAIMDFEK